MIPINKLHETWLRLEYIAFVLKKGSPKGCLFELMT
jgi:hypothetical protein